ncbi:YybH family protein [Eudoraea sp.]|uniref:YybH family protein n=1 Tax=Eudoraea sp. TaxID=1979955 RepID=UPI003C764807
MRNQISLLLLLLFVVQVAKGQSTNSKIEQEMLIRADKAWSHAAKTNDMEKLWSFWEDEAIILMSVDVTLKGIDQIKRFTTQARTDPNFEISWEVQGAEVSEKGEMGYTYGIGKVQRTNEAGELIITTKPYLTVWKKQTDGTWKCKIEN